MTHQQQVIAGRHPVREYLDRSPDKVDKVMLQKGVSGEGIGAIRSACAAAQVPLQYVPKGRLDVESRGATHQGVIAVTSPIAYHDFDALLRQIAGTWREVQDRRPLVLVLDRINDPRNYGAILRSAVGAGAAGVVVPETHMAPLTAVSIKASAGAAHRIPIARVDSLDDRLMQLKERGYWVVGAEGKADEDVWGVDLTRPVALVIGSEGSGLRQSVRERCDELVSIPLHGPIESLNASVAASIILFEVMRQRLGDKPPAEK